MISRLAISTIESADDAAEVSWTCPISDTSFKKRNQIEQTVQLLVHSQ